MSGGIGTWKAYFTAGDDTQSHALKCVPQYGNCKAQSDLNVTLASGVGQSCTTPGTLTGMTEGTTYDCYVISSNSNNPFNEPSVCSDSVTYIASNQPTNSITDVDVLENPMTTNSWHVNFYALPETYKYALKCKLADDSDGDYGEFSPCDVCSETTRICDITLATDQVTVGQVRSCYVLAASNAGCDGSNWYTCDHVSSTAFEYSMSPLGAIQTVAFSKPVEPSSSYTWNATWPRTITGVTPDDPADITGYDMTCTPDGGGVYILRVDNTYGTCSNPGALPMDAAPNSQFSCLIIYHWDVKGGGSATFPSQQNPYTFIGNLLPFQSFSGNPDTLVRPIDGDPTNKWVASWDYIDGTSYYQMICSTYAGGDDPPVDFQVTYKACEICDNYGDCSAALNIPIFGYQKAACHLAAAGGICSTSDIWTDQSCPHYETQPEEFFSLYFAAKPQTAGGTIDEWWWTTNFTSFFGKGIQSFTGECVKIPSGEKITGDPVAITDLPTCPDVSKVDDLGPDIATWKCYAIGYSLPDGQGTQYLSESVIYTNTGKPVGLVVITYNGTNPFVDPSYPLWDPQWIEMDNVYQYVISCEDANNSALFSMGFFKTCSPGVCSNIPGFCTETVSPPRDATALTCYVMASANGCEFGIDWNSPECMAARTASYPISFVKPE